TFPYVIDETQEVARAYDARCTPDFFGFNADDELQYRGRLDASRMSIMPRARRELFEAMTQVAQTGRGPLGQTARMGGSVKWRDWCIRACAARCRLRSADRWTRGK